MNNNGQVDYIQEAINKLYQKSWQNRQARMVAESIILGDLHAARRRGYKVVWVKEGALLIPFTSYQVK